MTAVSPSSFQRLPLVAAQASPSVSRWPIAAALATWATIPVTKISPIWSRIVPPYSDPIETIVPRISLAPALAVKPSSESVMPTVNVAIAVTTTGIIMVTAATSTAEPTVAFGLNRMIRKAAS
jgi:hypothetical protein